jgi:hypothetical protein
MAMSTPGYTADDVQAAVLEKKAARNVESLTPVQIPFGDDVRDWSFSNLASPEPRCLVLEAVGLSLRARSG